MDQTQGLQTVSVQESTMAEVAKVEDGKCFDGEAWMWDPFYSGSCDDVEIDIAASRINAVPNTSRTTTPLVRKRSLVSRPSLPFG